MLLFDWDDANIAHIARHGVTTEEAEQVIRNNPMDISYNIVGEEERFGQAGETDARRVLYIYTTPRGNKTRVVTCFEPSKANLLQYYEDKRSFYE